MHCQCWEGSGEGARPGQNLEALQGRLKNSALVCWSHALEARGNDCRPNNGWANHDIYGNRPHVVYHFHIPHPHHMPYQPFGFHPGAVPYNWSMGGMGMPQPYR